MGSCSAEPVNEQAVQGAENPWPRQSTSIPNIVTPRLRSAYAYYLAANFTAVPEIDTMSMLPLEPITS